MTNTAKQNELQGLSSQVVAPIVGGARQNGKKARNDCGEAVWRNLTPCQIETLAQKVYALLLDELRIEAERHGRILMR
jgi:hypothetical protein